MSDIEPGGRRPESRTTEPGTFGRLRDAAEAVGARAKAVGEGAYSVLPGTYNLGRAAARGVGLLGPEEYRRFNQEMDVTAGSLEQIVKHPEPAVRAAGRAVSTL